MSANSNKTEEPSPCLVPLSALFALNMPKTRLNSGFSDKLWRRGRDSNPRALARKLISSHLSIYHFIGFLMLLLVVLSRQNPHK